MYLAKAGSTRCGDYFTRGGLSWTLVSLFADDGGCLVYV